MPYSVTIARAIVVARSMSFAAPVVGSPNTISSAVRPPSSIASCVLELAAAHEVLVLASGSASVQPSARPRGMIDTLWTGSVPGSTCADQRVAALVVGDDRASPARR